MSEDNSAIYRRVKVDEWPSGLSRQLKLNYTGCKSLLEAVRKVIEERHSRINETAQPNETASQTMDKQLAVKLKQVQDIVAQKMEKIDQSKIPQEDWDRLAKMPLDSIETIRAWGFSCLDVIKKVQS